MTETASGMNRPPNGLACCLGMRRWKRKAVTDFLGLEGLQANYFDDAKPAIAAARRVRGCVVVWASKSDAALKAACTEAGVDLYHMEDGFLRSRGLGASHVEPVSLVLDRSGIYYDATQVSDLEVILETGEITDEDLDQARSLRVRIVSNRLSKYNVGQDQQLPVGKVGGRIVLVPGQVADDASLRLGAGAGATNFNLLKVAREDNPDAFIVYKPHPDVEAGKRSGLLPARTVLQYADYIVAEMSSHAAISMADEVVTMTSLLGFEALLIGKAVTCHGMPFYAGWGVTHDRVHCVRRTRSRTVDEILAAAYVRYARYIDPSSRQQITAIEAAGLLTFTPS